MSLRSGGAGGFTASGGVASGSGGEEHEEQEQELRPSSSFPESAQRTPPPERSAIPSLHGYLVIDKPAGWTSFDVVARTRRLLGEKRIGHAGTLDPAATGVLPLAVGMATKTLEFLNDASKTYLADVTFGVETDSHDIEGRVTRTAGTEEVTADAVETVLAQFRGAGQQVPPMHAAIKVGGQKLYDLARRGEEIPRSPRPVTFHVLEMLEWNPPVATLLVDCSKGTYIRALARDLGAALGTGAYLSNLVRLRAGPFHLCQAITIDELTRMELPWAWPWVAVHPDIPVQAWPALILDEHASRGWRQGSPIPAACKGKVSGSIRVYDAAGDWLGTGDAAPDGSGWRPRKVIAADKGGAALRGAAASGLRGDGGKEHEGSDRRFPLPFSPLERSDPL